MDQINPFIVGIRFSPVGKVYHFDASHLQGLKVGDQVVVETSRGWQLGSVAQVVAEPVPPAEGWKAVERLATPRDLLLRQFWQKKEENVTETCRKRISELNLQGVKAISSEYSFDGVRLTIMYSSETEEKVDLKSLRQDMQKAFAPAQVELRQIGPRDVAKILGGMGACGLESRCCSKFLTEFSSISIRMAKEQGVSLTPTEITGMCGRLRCCLIYEYEQYVEARAKLPKRNKVVVTPVGVGKVLDVLPLRQGVMVDLPEVGRREFNITEIRIPEEGEDLAQLQAELAKLAQPTEERPERPERPERIERPMRPAGPPPQSQRNEGQPSETGSNQPRQQRPHHGSGRQQQSPAQPQGQQNQPGEQEKHPERKDRRRDRPRVQKGPAAGGPQTDKPQPQSRGDSSPTDADKTNSPEAKPQHRRHPRYRK